MLSSFEARDLGAASLFLGMLITRDRAAKTIKLSQPRHINDLLAKFQMTDAKPYETPSSAAIKLTAEGEPLDTTVYPYSTAIGSLMYIASCTRPDIAQAVGALARYMAAPTTAHWTAVKHILRYLAGTPDYGITYGPDTFSLAAYCDASYAGCLDTRRSTTGYVFILNGGAITWSSRLQSTVAVSTTEAEYMAAAAATKEALWLRTLFADLGLPVPCINIAADNQAARTDDAIAEIRSTLADLAARIAEIEARPVETQAKPRTTAKKRPKKASGTANTAKGTDLAAIAAAVAEKRAKESDDFSRAALWRELRAAGIKVHANPAAFATAVKKIMARGAV